MGLPSIFASLLIPTIFGLEQSFFQVNAEIYFPNTQFIRIVAPDSGVSATNQLTFNRPRRSRNSTNPLIYAQTPDPVCLKPVLSRLLRHKVTAGETLESIARRYDLVPTTLMGLNPIVRSGKVKVGTELLVPPFNGIRVEVPAGKTWRDLAALYKVRADVLFEVNGCRPVAKVIFVPGVNWSPLATQPTRSGTQVQKRSIGYPLPQTAAIVLNYGWRLIPTTSQVAFHSGVDLAAPAGTTVLASADGTIAFAGKQDAYGNLVVINHAGGRQTRYAQLGSIQVKTGQSVRKGDTIGTVGSTGIPSSFDSHLHFEVRLASNLGWVAQDPVPYLP